MHIVDGALSTPVLVAGAAVTVAGLGLGLRNLNPDRVPQVGILSAAFFVASLVHVPLGPTSVHLILGGLAGLVLGWAAFPAVFVGLLLRAVFFGFGGITVLGVNTMNIAVPAVLLGVACRPLLRSTSEMAAIAGGAIAGGGAVALTCLLVGAALALSGDAFVPAAKLVFVAHLPVMAVEGVVTGAVVALVRKVRPDLFALPLRSPA